MATKPLELQSLKWPFVGLAVLLALCTGWAVYDEVFPRRPWKAYQREFFQLEGLLCDGLYGCAPQFVAASVRSRLLEHMQHELNDDAALLVLARLGGEN